MKLVWLLRASMELATISNDIARGDPAAADAVRLGIIASVDRLGRYPEAGRTGHVKGTREIDVVACPYIVVYRIKGDEVQILTVRHTSRQWPE
jgi:plasmid stabilization system protein ParE